MDVAIGDWRFRGKISAVEGENENDRPLSVGVTIAGPAQASGSARREEVAKLADLHWWARGCPEGSPEDDLLRAGQEIQQQLGQAAKLFALTLSYPSRYRAAGRFRAVCLL